MLHIIRMTAIGDALGAGEEYAPEVRVKNYRIDDGYRQNPQHHEVGPGMWTDDTMMSVAAARGLIFDQARQECKVLPTTLADQMVSLHKRHRSEGCNAGMLAALDGSQTGTDLRASFDRHGRTANNGAAMRSACYGVLGSIEQVRQASRDCAALTHQGLGVEGAFAVAAASHHFVHGGYKEDLDDFLAEHVNPIYTTRMHNRVAKQNGPLTFLTVCAALTAIKDSNTLTQVVERSIRVGGDVDTVAAIAMGIAASSVEIENDLPAWVFEGIRPVGDLTWEDLAVVDSGLTKVREAGR